MQSLHNILLIKSKLYMDWHENKRHPLYHWVFFIAIAFFAGNFLLGQMDLLSFNSYIKIARAAGSTYYLSTSGNDSAAGTSSAPWKTFSKAWGVLQGGDTLIVNDGTYTSVTPPTAKSGSAGNFITIQAANDGGVTFPFVSFKGSSYLAFIGMKFVASDRAVDIISNGSGKQSHHLTFQRISFNCTTTSTADDACFMIEDGTNNLLLEDSWVWGGARYTVECY